MIDRERERILAVYRQRNLADSEAHRFLGYDNLAHFVRVQERHRETAKLLVEHNFTNMPELRFLDVGCGRGNLLQMFTAWGAEQNNLAGIDLQTEEVERAKRVLPGADLITGDASKLPWEDSQFDLVSQHTVFTSILDRGMRNAVASEMKRVLRPGGGILWYDFTYNNPRNPDVQGVKAEEVAELFPGFDIHLKRITLAPPIARRIPTRMLPVVYPVLSILPMTRTHLLGLLVKREK